jgi:hypothetical protein
MPTTAKYCYLGMSADEWLMQDIMETAYFSESIVP